MCLYHESLKTHWFPTLTQLVTFWSWVVSWFKHLSSIDMSVIRAYPITHSLTHTHTHARAHAHTHIHTHTHTHTHTHIFISNGVTGIFHWHNPSDHTMALGLTQPLTEMSTGNISWGYRQPLCRADNLATFICRLSWNLGASTWNPQDLSRLVMGLLYLYFYLYMYINIAVLTQYLAATFDSSFSI